MLIIHVFDPNNCMFLYRIQASDVAISQFRFLVPLLFCHGVLALLPSGCRFLHVQKTEWGRRAYRRVATFICYMFYKHTVLAVGDIFFAHQITSEPPDIESSLTCSLELPSIVFSFFFEFYIYYLSCFLWCFMLVCSGSQPKSHILSGWTLRSWPRNWLCLWRILSLPCCRFASVICGLPVVVVVSLDYDIPDKVWGMEISFTLTIWTTHGKHLSN